MLDSAHSCARTKEMVMRVTKYQLHKRFASTMPNPTFGDVEATDQAEGFCATLTFSPDGPLEGVAILNRVIRYLHARRDGLTQIRREALTR